MHPDKTFLPEIRLCRKIRPGCVDSIDRTDALLFAGDLLYYICYTIYNIKIVENSIETERGERYEAVSGKTEPAF